MTRPLVLLSGGVDSAVCLALVRDQDPICLAVDYGQAHSIELTFAARIAKFYRAHLLTKHAPRLGKTDDVVFSGRNLLMVSLAVSLAPSYGCDQVILGCNRSDWERFPDCRPEFWLPVTGAIGEAYGIRVELPLLHLDKAAVVKRAMALGVPLGETWSCYSPVPTGDGYTPCGTCLSCRTREKAIQDAVHG